MAQALEVSLTTEQEHELSWARDHQEKFYLRVKCAAILNVAHGCSVRQVARTGLLKPVRQETVSEWTRRYLAEGRDGLHRAPGRHGTGVGSTTRLFQRERDVALLLS